MSIDGWTRCHLGASLTLQRGFDLPHRVRREGRVAVISSSGFSGTHDSAKCVAPGVVTGRYGTIGQVFFVTEDFWPLNTTLFVSDFKGNDPQFLSYLLRTVDFKTHSGKSGVPGVNRNDIHKLSIDLPPRAEQRAIADALSDVDGLLGSLDALIAKKQAIKQATMQRLLTGRTRLPGFTGVWKHKRIGDIFTIRVGTSKTRFITPGGAFLIVDMGSVSRDGHLIADKPTDFGSDFLEKGELVMPKDDIGGGHIIGKVAHIDANNKYVLGDHVYALRLVNDRGDARFFSYLINSYVVASSLRSKVSGSAQLGLARVAVQEQDLMVPRLEEQAAIATVLSDMDAEIDALERRREKTRSIKLGMMQQLLTGRTRLVEPREPVEASA